MVNSLCALMRSFSFPKMLSPLFSSKSSLPAEAGHFYKTPGVSITNLPQEKIRAAQVPSK
jgi:hypothetical protein